MPVRKVILESKFHNNEWEEKVKVTPAEIDSRKLKISNWGRIYIMLYNGCLYKLHKILEQKRFRWISLQNSVAWTSISGNSYKLIKSWETVEEALQHALNHGAKIVQINSDFFDNLRKTLEE